MTNSHDLIDFISQVTVNDLNTSTEGTQIFDNIFVANGHNSVPSIPEFEGQSKFQGRVLHSHEYRRPEIFKGSLL